MKLYNLYKPVLALISLLCALGACTPTNPHISKSSVAANTGIIGGVPVDAVDSIAISTVAIIASVITPDDQEGQFVCTGSMLEENMVLTAAHCVPEVGELFKAVELFVIFNTDLHQMQPTDVRRVIAHAIHAGYGKSGEYGEDDHDIAVIKFDGIMPSEYKLAKFLEDESHLKAGAVVTLAGYGLIETDGVNTRSDDRLRKVDVQIIQDYGNFEVLLDQSHGRGACHGDSGGPAFIEIQGTHYVWGVTSRGAGKDGRDDCSLVSVYTKIKAESEFIEQARRYLR